MPHGDAPSRSEALDDCLRWVRSDDVDVPNLDGVVAVAEPVPWRDIGLDVAGGIGGAGAEAVPSGVVGLPAERPVLPLVRSGGRFDLGFLPLPFAGEADVDRRDGAGS